MVPLDRMIFACTELVKFCEVCVGGGGVGGDEAGL